MKITQTKPFKMPLQYVVTRRNKKKLIDHSHLFVKEKTSGEKTIWKCDQFYTRKCHARVHTNNESIIKRLGEHNHAGDIARVEAAKVINVTKEKRSQFKKRHIAS